MSSIKRTYNLTITTLTPLHIGTGNDLLLNYDYVKHNGRTWVIDEDTLAEMLINEDPNDFDRMVRGTPACDLIRPDEYRVGNPLFRYVLQGEPRANRSGAKVQELLKDAWDHPYIPGSSLKGALRTAIMFYGWVSKRHRLDARELGNSAKFAARPLEAKVLYGNKAMPYFDLLRALQVTDSTPDDDRHMQLLNVSAVTPRNSGAPIEIEAIAEGRTFYAQIAVDEYIRLREVTTEKRGHETTERVRERLGFDKEQSLWLRNLPIMVNTMTESRLRSEQERWQHVSGNVRGFYNHLVREFSALPENAFILQLGWGGGWDSKTLGEILTSDEKQFVRIANNRRYRMMRKGSYKPGDLFPKSRRLIMQNNQPFLPLGWIKVTMEKIS